jgi:hypothetical protein
MKKNKFILDACCGGRMMWFNKHHPNTLYIDIRKEDKNFIKAVPNFEIKPDYVMDFRKMDFSDNSFKLVVWDVPHLLSNRVGNSIFRKKFGVLNVETWQSDLIKGFKECWRVLEDYGVLLFKWNDNNINHKKVLQLLPIKPLFGNISSGSGIAAASKTYWFCFMKIP